MIAKTSFIVSSVLASFAAADLLSLYVGEACRSANLGRWQPIPLGECIDISQASSYIMEKSDRNVYNIYSGGGCHQYEGQVEFSGCLTKGEGQTGILNIGPQDKKRWVRGANALGAREARVSLSERAPEVEQRVPDAEAFNATKRQDGSTFQCVNVPSGQRYWFSVQHSSATHEEFDNTELYRLERNFDRAFEETMGTTPWAQTVEATATSDDPNEIRIRLLLSMNEDTIRAIESQDAESLVENLNEFRNQQRNPIEFYVSLYTGEVDHPIGGPLAEMRFGPA